MIDSIENRFEFTYESGAAGSYLVLSCSKDEKIINYQVEMLSNNPNKNILPLDLRQKNDKLNMYYTITSKLTLSHYLKRNKLKRDEFIGIFSDVTRVILKSKDYLLSDKSFFLNEEFIYLNPDNMDVSLVYLPVNLDLDINSVFKEFTLKFIMYSANLDETNSDNFLQKILNSLKSETFSILEFDNLLNKLREEAKRAEVSQQDNQETVSNIDQSNVSGEQFSTNEAHQKPNVQKLAIPKLDISKTGVTESNTPKFNISKSNPQIPNVPKPNMQPAMPQSPLQNSPNNSIKKMKYKTSAIIAGSSIQAVLAIGAILLITSGALNPLGNDMATNAVVVVLLVGAASYFVWKKVLDKNNMIENDNTEAQTPISTPTTFKPTVDMGKREIRTVPTPAIPVSQPNLQKKPQSLEKVSAPSIPNSPIKNTVSQYRSMPLDETTILSEDNLNDTVFLGFNTKAPYLQGMRDGVLEEISIKKPSFFIGRLSEQVDYVSSNNAIGKVHAEIISRNGSYYIKDMNSRNGTFINGERIDSNQEYEIKNDDKIMLANSEFTFVVP